MLLPRRYSTGVAVLTPLLLALLCRESFAGNEKNYTYLALGDSVAYGLDVRLLQDPNHIPLPNKFKGYPETVADFEHLTQSKKEVNASCPGETSGSFIDISSPDYGCNTSRVPGGLPFKTAIGLHANYTGSQLDFAVSELSSNKHINLVTLGIGSNDVLLCFSPNPPAVCANLGNVFGAYAANLQTILTAIRAHYKGTLVLVEYYSPSQDLDGIALAINGIMEAVGAGFNVRYADGFTAFKMASIPFQGDPCKAGLVIQFPDGTCDIHPSIIGRDILAGIVEFAIHAH
jgi:lysophospholipase L1-like esterase